MTERKIGHSIDCQVQKEYFSHRGSGSKRGTHTIKDLAIVTLAKEVIYLVRILAELKFPEQDHCICADLGFLGIQVEHAVVILSEKKPKDKELTNYQKELNGLIASIRVTVEHTIAGIKRLKIIRNQIRLHGWQARDRALAVACGRNPGGLQNIRCQR